MHVVRSNTPWPEKFCRRASVNSFGHGGANAHVIIDAADVSGWRVAKYFTPTITNPELRICLQNGQNGIHPITDRQLLYVFSAHDHATLLRNITAISQVAGKYDPNELAYTLAARSMLSNRAFGITTAGKLSQNLEEGKMKFGVSHHHRPKLAFAFTGQGAQWPQMGYALFQYFPSVRRTFQELQRALDNLPNPPEWNLLGIVPSIRVVVKSLKLCF